MDRRLEMKPVSGVIPEGVFCRWVVEGNKYDDKTIEVRRERDPVFGFYDTLQF
jgi:hypothetical protein